MVDAPLSVLVTGATSPLGFAIAEAFARDGAFVGVHFRGDESAACAVVERCRELGGDGLAVRADLTRGDEAG